MRGDVGEWNAAQVPMGPSVTAILDAIGIPHWHRFHDRHRQSGVRPSSGK